MKKLFAYVVASILVTSLGCNQQNPGGPGVTSQPTTTGNSTTTTAKKPVLGEAVDTFDVNAPALATRIKQGESNTAKISLSRGKNFVEDVSLTVTDLPTGVTVEPALPNIKSSDKEATITLTAAPDAAVGEFTAKVLAHPEKGPDATSTMKITVLKK